MSRNSSYASAAVLSLVLAAGLGTAFAADAPSTSAAQTAGASTQDKAKACNDAADKKGLKDEERKTFMQNCLKKMKK